MEMLVAFLVSANAGTIVTTTLAVDVRPPPVAVTVRVAVPAIAAVPAAMVNTLEPDPGAAKPPDASVAVTPAGAPLTESVTALLNPPATTTFAADAALPPCPMVKAPADMDTFIEGAGETTDVSPQ
jgi:hypothetical protein